MKPYRQYISGLKDNVSRSLDVHGEQNKQQSNGSYTNQNNSFHHLSSTNNNNNNNNNLSLNLNNSYSHQTNPQPNQVSNRYKPNPNYAIPQDKRLNQKRPTTNAANRSFNGLGSNNNNSNMNYNNNNNNRGGSQQNSINQSPQFQGGGYSNTISYDQEISVNNNNNNNNNNSNNNVNVVYNNYLNNTINVDKDVRKQVAVGQVRSYSSANNYNDKQERLKSVYGQRQVNSAMDNNYPTANALSINGTMPIHSNAKSHSLNPSRNGNRGMDDQLNTPNTASSTISANKNNSITPRENNVLRKLNGNGIVNPQNKQKRPLSPRSNGISINNLNNFQIQIPQTGISNPSSSNSQNTYTSGQRLGMNGGQKSQQQVMKARQNSKHNYTFSNYLNMPQGKVNPENTSTNNIANPNINFNKSIVTPTTYITNTNNQLRNGSASKNASSKASIQQLIKNQQQQQQQQQQLSEQGKQRKQPTKMEQQDQTQQKQARQFIGLSGVSYNGLQKNQTQSSKMPQKNNPPKNMQQYLQENSLDMINVDGSSSTNSNAKENSRPNSSIQKQQLNMLTQKRNSFENVNRNIGGGVPNQRRLKSSQGKYGRGTSNENRSTNNGVHSSLDTYQSILESKEKNENTMRHSLNISTIDNSMLDQIRPSFKITLSHRTRQGVLASNPNKTNQDSFIISQNLMNKTTQHFYAVCDGHGANGHHVSQFIKQQLPLLLSNDWQLLANNPKAALYNAIGLANHKLALTNIDCMFSGTTLVSVLLQGNKLYSANVGDSRATIGRLSQKGLSQKYVPRPLTRDHKPDLQGETERIIQFGGRIDTFRDQEGNHLGPQRVWLKTENIPGLAMSRSIGDNLATSVGVTWEPEIFEFDIDKDDKFMIVASDGVWEFIENEEIINMIAPFYMNNDLEGACDIVLKESYARWTVDDDSVIDDITLIIIFFDHNDNIQVGSRPNSRSSTSQRNTNYNFHSIDNSQLSYNNNAIPNNN